MSTLVMVPALLHQLRLAAPLAIVTTDSSLFTEDLLGISDPAERASAAHPGIAVLLFTCRGVPVVTPAVRRMAGVPIYDITTVCRVTLESVLSTGLIHA